MAEEIQKQRDRLKSHIDALDEKGLSEMEGVMQRLLDKQRGSTHGKVEELLPVATLAPPIPPKEKDSAAQPITSQGAGPSSERASLPADEKLTPDRMKKALQFLDAMTQSIYEFGSCAKRLKVQIPESGETGSPLDLYRGLKKEREEFLQPECTYRSEMISQSISKYWLMNEYVKDICKNILSCRVSCRNRPKRLMLGQRMFCNGRFPVPLIF